MHEQYMGGGGGQGSGEPVSMAYYFDGAYSSW